MAKDPQTQGDCKVAPLTFLSDQEHLLACLNTEEFEIEAHAERIEISVTGLCNFGNYTSVPYSVDRILTLLEDSPLTDITGVIDAMRDQGHTHAIILNTEEHKKEIMTEVD